MEWVAAPDEGSSAFLNVVLSDDRPDLPPLEIGSGNLVGTLAMSNGWHLSVIHDERALREEEMRPLYEIRDDVKIGIDALPEAGSTMGAIVWVATSPDGPPIFTHIVLGSDNFYVR